MLSLAINFLAGFAGLGKVADKVMVVINKIRAPIDKALNWLVGWIVKAAKSFVAKGKAAVGKLVRWAFAKTTFKDAQGKQHSLYVSETGALTVASTPQAAREFVEWYVKQYKGDPRIAAEALKLILKAEALVAVIEKTPQKDPNEPPAPAKQQELLGLSNQISTLLSQLIDTRSDVGKSEEKYLLEGQVGTYATIPKPVGDKLTPDHQPQASIIVGAGEFFQEQLGIADGPLAARAFQRANQGFAINLHFKRHVAGATYGSKGETKQSFKDRLIAGRKATDTKDQAKAKVVAELRTALKKDAKRMRDVAALDVTAEPWKQLKEDVTDDARAKALKTQIADRIVKGENQIESQPFDF